MYCVSGGRVDWQNTWTKSPDFEMHQYCTTMIRNSRISIWGIGGAKHSVFFSHVSQDYQE